MVCSWLVQGYIGYSCLWAFCGTFLLIFRPEEPLLAKVRLDIGPCYWRPFCQHDHNKQASHSHLCSSVLMLHQNKRDYFNGNQRAKIRASHSEWMTMYVFVGQCVSVSVWRYTPCIVDQGKHRQRPFHYSLLCELRNCHDWHFVKWHFKIFQSKAVIVACLVILLIR